MTEFQEKLIQTFKVFVRFCEENGLTYYAAFGTCLGAVRHKGFIPWDDDMDVFMLREDYERMLSSREQLNNSIYRVTDFRDGKHPYTFAKFYSIDCSVWEYKQFQFIIGPWIDIFPLDEWNDKDDTSKLYDDYHYALWKYRKALSVQSWNEIWSDLINRNGYNGLIKLVKKCLYSPFEKSFHNKALDLLNQVIEINGDFYKNWNHKKKIVYQKKWFDGFIEFQFEDTKISCPVGYDDYLSYEYGNYMELPPIESRVSNHRFFYADLKNKKTAEEILKELDQKGELSSREAPPLSFKVLIDEIVHRKGF